jgi:tetratricopeptide (TPR) repeat protein
MRCNVFASTLLASGLLASAPALYAQSLGTIEFPTSGTTEAQPHFLRGVLYMHSFEYDAAASAFREAQRIDPDFAMAYWGEAMTQTHPIWNEQDADAAGEVLQRLAPTAEARRAKAPTERERAWLDAVEILYGEGPKARRDTLYSAALERMSDRFPDDAEVRAFHALSLLGLSQGVRDVPTYLRAGAIAETVFARNPDHPGAAHYVIHAYDAPAHADRGLAAARAYSKIAPDAAHAQHMTTHIFLALGMWDDVVSQNIAAAGHDHDRMIAGHYTIWLEYGYLMQGRYDRAREHLETLRSNADSPPNARDVPGLIASRAQYLINSERWDDDVAAWPVELPSGGFHALRAQNHFALGYAAVRRGDRGMAERHLAALSELRQNVPSADVGTAHTVTILEHELRAAAMHAAGDSQNAVALLREAAASEDALPIEFGPPAIVKPTHELLGEVLIDLGRADEAVREFQRALELAPKRAPALLGLGRAAAAAGESAIAQRAFSDLAAIWHQAEPGTPGFAEAMGR